MYSEDACSYRRQPKTSRQPVSRTGQGILGMQAKLLTTRTCIFDETHVYVEKTATRLRDLTEMNGLRAKFYVDQQLDYKTRSKTKFEHMNKGVCS